MDALTSVAVTLLLPAGDTFFVATEYALAVIAVGLDRPVPDRLRGRLELLGRFLGCPAGPYRLHYGALRGVWSAWVVVSPARVLRIAVPVELGGDLKGRPPVRPQHFVRHRESDSARRTLSRTCLNHGRVR